MNKDAMDARLGRPANLGAGKKIPGQCSRPIGMKLTDVEETTARGFLGQLNRRCGCPSTGTVGFFMLEDPEPEGLFTPAQAHAVLKKQIAADAATNPPVPLVESYAWFIKAMYYNRMFATYCGECFETLALTKGVYDANVGQR
jgi:hypothetical protein